MGYPESPKTGFWDSGRGGGGGVRRLRSKKWLPIKLRRNPTIFPIKIAKHVLLRGEKGVREAFRSVFGHQI